MSAGLALQLADHLLAIVGNRPDRDAAARFARLAWEPLRKRLPADVGVHLPVGPLQSPHG